MAPVFAALLGLLPLVSSFAVPNTRKQSYGSLVPLSISGRDILSPGGETFYYSATNLPGHQEAMIPEGLQYQSAAQIAQHVADLGLNSVRLTFAIELVDQIIAAGGKDNVTLEAAMKGALGETNGTRVLAEILEHNTAFTKDTTRLEAFDAVAHAFADKGVIVHLDNHVSKAVWCCGTDDGNGWFGEEYFNVDNWVRAWGWMAKHASENWPSFASVGLRNELRAVSKNTAEPVDWYTWNTHMTAAATAVHESAPEALIFFSGFSFDTYIDPIPLGQQLNGTAGTSTDGKTAFFDPSKLPFENKIVLELHKYDFENTQDDCDTFASKWYPKGWQALNASDPATKHVFPVVLSEWGFIQNGVYWNQTTYAKCLVETVKKWKYGWMQWDLAGSYYLRTSDGASTQDMDESWGLLNHNWTAVRSPVTVENSLQKMIDAHKS